MQRICQESGIAFEVTPDELQLLEQISPVFGGKKYLIPPPKLCPDMRMRRRLAFRNERSLYQRKSDMSGKNMISLFSPDKKYKVFHQDEWWSDSWEGTNFGRDFEFSKPFFQQFDELLHDVPLLALWNMKNKNAEYNNNCFEMKNSYMNFNTDHAERFFYCYGCDGGVDSADCTFSQKTELCYECIDCMNVYRCFFSNDLENSRDCYFSSDLKGCSNCIGSHGLRNKQFYAFNQPLSQEEWERLYGNLQLTHENITEFKKRSYEVSMTVPKRALHMINTENSLGDHLFNCKDVQDSYEIVNAENVKHAIYGPFITKNVHDAYAFGGIEYGYEIVGGGDNCYNIAFIVNPFNGPSYSYYCFQCVNGSKNLFGCVGLKRKEYCILNKQYTKEEYEALMPRIIEHMEKTGEWGEMFPMAISPYCYNETMAEEMFPMGRETAIAKGLKWYEIPEKEKTAASGDFLTCEITGKPYRITAQEMTLYGKLGVPVPKRCPEQRHYDRMALRNPRKLYERTCAKTGEKIFSTYSPNRPEIVYSEKAYLESIY